MSGGLLDLQADFGTTRQTVGLPPIQRPLRFQRMYSENFLV